MANTTMLQVRTDPVDREKAAEILNSLGTNLSAVVNMLLKQIIITESIPFEIKLHHPAYTIMQGIKETRATLAMEGMDLTEEEIQMLTDYNNGKVSGDELRRTIIASVSDAGRDESTGDL